MFDAIKMKIFILTHGMQTASEMYIGLPMSREMVSALSGLQTGSCTNRHSPTYHGSEDRALLQRTDIFILSGRFRPERADYKILIKIIISSIQSKVFVLMLHSNQYYM
mgnify:CR=1 FL=1